jgi:Ca2+-binding EF-hand superfamily protein
MKDTLPTLLANDLTAPTAYVAWLKRSQSEAAMQVQKTGPKEKVDVRKKRVIADIDLLAELNPVMALRAKKSSHEEVSLSHSKKRWPRSSSTSVLEKAVGPKKLDPLMTWPTTSSLSQEPSASKANDDNMRSTGRRLQRPSSTPALEKPVGRKKLDPLASLPTWDSLSMERNTKNSHGEATAAMRPNTSMMRHKSLAPLNHDGCIDITQQKERKTGMKGSNGTLGLETSNVSMFTRRPNHVLDNLDSEIKKPISSGPPKKQFLCDNSAEDVRQLKAQLLPYSMEKDQWSGVTNADSQTSKPGQKSQVSNTKADEITRGELPDASQKQCSEPTQRQCAEVEQSDGDKGKSFDALQFARRVSRDLNCPLDTTKEARGLFDRFANSDQTRHVKLLDFCEFGDIVKYILKSTGQKLSKADMKAKIESCWKEADRNHNQKVDFDEFAIWYSSWGFQQELLLSPQQILSRDLAKKYDLSVADVDSVQAKFRKFDEDGSGVIEFHEFEKLLYNLMKIPRGQELPANRLKHFWKEIDLDGSGFVDCEEFLYWYMRYFDMKGNSDYSPAEQLYQSLRPHHARFQMPYM